MIERRCRNSVKTRCGLRFAFFNMASISGKDEVVRFAEACPRAKSSSLAWHHAWSSSCSTTSSKSSPKWLNSSRDPVVDGAAVLRSEYSLRRSSSDVVGHRDLKLPRRE